MQAAQNICHRCSSTLPEDALFCTQCGSPQLVLTEADAQRVAEERAASLDGSKPQPRVPAMGRIRWRPVLHIVAGLAMITGVASALGNALPFFVFIRTLLILFGSVFAITLYLRRVPGAAMSAGIGARIGAMVGVMVGATVTAVNMVFVLVYRYPMHNGGQMDRDINAAMQQSLALAMKTYPGLYPDSQQTGLMLQFFQSPDGHAMLALGAAAFVALFTLAYSVISGGIWGWRIRMRVKSHEMKAQ